MTLVSHEGLGIIPRTILEQGTWTVAQYLLDLFKSKDADPDFRTKLMVVGYENVGKSTLLDCLFPLEGLSVAHGVRKKSKLFRLQGTNLTLYHGPTAETGIDREVVFGDKVWSVSTFGDTGVRLTTQKKGAKDFELRAGASGTREEWFHRFRRVCVNKVTHGIDIQTAIMDTPATRDHFARRVKPAAPLRFSVWDFAGQHDFYNSHHFFLSTRAVFLVLWKISDAAGMQGLEFWFASLATHVAPPSAASSSSSSPAAAVGNPAEFSVIVVGTFLDDPSVIKEDKSEREKTIVSLAEKHRVTCGIQYFEVSCSGSQMTNIDVLRDVIAISALGHSYMEEKVPKAYLSLLGHLKERIRNKPTEAPSGLSEIASRSSLALDSPDSPIPASLPLVKVDDIVTFMTSDEAFVKRALSISLWGECVYFDSHPELASMVVLDPRFLVKDILSDLFTCEPNVRQLTLNGKVKHESLAKNLDRISKEPFESRGVLAHLSVSHETAPKYGCMLCHPR